MAPGARYKAGGADTAATRGADGKTLRFPFFRDEGRTAGCCLGGRRGGLIEKKRRIEGAGGRFFARCQVLNPRPWDGDLAVHV
jgi:hypothetical protein